MSIVRYLDANENKEFFKVRVVKKSVHRPGVSIDLLQVGIPTLQEAQKVEQKLGREADRKLLASEAVEISWGVLCEGWLEAATKGDIFARQLARSSIDQYYSALREFTQDWWKLPADQIDRAKAWVLLERVDRDYSVGRRKNLRTAIDGVFEWAIRSGRLRVVDSVPTEGYRSNRKVPDPLPEILTIAQIRDLLKYAKADEHLWYPIWALALMTGMRSGELFALKWSAVDLENMLIFVHLNWTNKEGYHETKGGYWRTVPLNDEAASLLKSLRLKRNAAEFVLPHFMAWEQGRAAELLRVFCIGHGLPSIRFHTLRACFATQLIREAVAPATVMKICGWKDLKTMQRYIRLSGIDVGGATNSLKIMPPEAAVGILVDLFKGGVKS